MKTLVSVSNLRKSYGRQTVLDDVSFVLTDGVRIALIGRNGAGKTTLLRILTGTEELDAGTVTVLPDARLGVLDQHEVLPNEGTAIEHLMERTGKAAWACEKMAARFGMRAEDLRVAPGVLSGGYQMRIKIIRMFLVDPNLLILDEPVNYLDLPTLLHFERFLKTFTGAFVITSHDREILNNICTTTWEVSRGRLTTFSGDPDTYLDHKEEQAEFLRRTNKKLRKEISAAQEFVDRFKFKASQASRAQSKVKHISKLRSKLKSMDQELPTAAFRIVCEPPAGGPAVRCLDLSIGYNGVAVAKNIGIEIPRGSKAAIVGENGRGKSTFLKTLAGAIPPVGGEAKWWHRADIGYFSQMAEDTLPVETTVLQALTTAAPPSTSSERILATAGAFLFKEDDLEKTCGVLSGGERARVRLARLTLQQHNVLLLDEPTNHLDAETVEVLATALKEYVGTVIVVSHARTFMNALVDRIYEVRNGSVRQFMSTYEDYVAELSAAQDEEILVAVPVDEDGAQKRERAAQDKERRRLRQRLEEKLNKLEREKSEILAWFFENTNEYSPEKSERLGVLHEEIAFVEKEWMGLSD